MYNEMVKNRCFTPQELILGQDCLNILFLCIGILTLSGCVTTGKSSPLAPTPPVMNSLVSTQAQNDIRNETDFSKIGNEEYVKVAAIIDGSNGGVLSPLETQSAIPDNAKAQPSLALAGCRLKDRFDRKAVLAYEWDRSRLALDVDGVNMGGGGEKGFRVEYKLRLQPEKPKTQRCRYSSKWQGLVGSGYNELFVRESDTVWTEIKDIKNQASEYIDKLF